MVVEHGMDGGRDGSHGQHQEILMVARLTAEGPEAAMVIPYAMKRVGFITIHNALDADDTGTDVVALAELHALAAGTLEIGYLHKLGVFELV